MLLGPVDWACVIAFFVISLVIGIAVARRAGSSSAEFFAAGKQMPWWLLGVSMVATTFSTDTPNLVTDFVRNYGVAGNWQWWAFLLTGMLTVFVYAQLWKRSGVLTDIEFYELRYSGKEAAFLRGFRALYLGVLFNVVIMASVTLAAIKIGAVLFNLTPLQTIFIGSVVTVIYSSLGGLRGVLITDFIQFILAMVGAVGAAIVAVNLPQVGGLDGMLNHPLLQDKLSLFPDLSNTELAFTLLIMPLAVQWWSVWYPGAEPGGGGYIAQRMLAAKDDENAVGAVFFFNAAHYALRPWPWIIVALCSLIVFPDLASLREAFPHAADRVGHDMGYPAMLTFLPAGLLGLVVASLIAAFMSTISTHLNWGASYIVHDFYRRFVRPQAEEKELVRVGRISTVLLMLLAGFVALQMETAMGNFQILLQIGAGTGLLFILRWFWWRINAYSEIAAMGISFVVALYFRFVHAHTGLPAVDGWMQIPLAVAITTVGWILVTLMTQPTSHDTLVRFCRLVRAGGPGWQKVLNDAEAAGESTEHLGTGWNLPQGILCMFLGCVAIYSALFSTGYWLYGRYGTALLTSVTAVIATFLLVGAWKRLLGR
jgi:solute:Na+ symporter, SSS family